MSTKLYGITVAANTWTSSADGVWSNASNWSLGHKPAIGEDVVFDVTGTGNCSMDENSAVLNSFTMTVGNAANFNDAGFNIDANTGISFTITNLITLTLNGALTVHGDGNVKIDGNMAGDYSDGYFFGHPSIKMLGSGTISLTWYHILFDGDNTLEWLAVDPLMVDVAYPGKTIELTYGGLTFGDVCGIKLNGGTIHEGTYSFNLSMKFDDTTDFVLNIDPNTVFDVATPPMSLFLNQHNTAPRTLLFPVFNIPNMNIQFMNGLYKETPITADVTVEFTGDVHCYEMNYYGNFPATCNWTFITNNNDLTMESNFVPSPNNPLYTQTMYCGSSVITIKGQVFNDRTPGNLFTLYLESSTWIITGGNVTDIRWRDALWGIYNNIEIVPGSSTIRIQPATAMGYSLYLPASPFNNFYVEPGLGYIGSLNSNLLQVNREFRWENSGTLAASTGIAMTGATGIIKLSNNFHGRLQTKTPGQSITFETLSGSVYTIDSNSIGDIGGSVSSAVIWQSATPSTAYNINATVVIDAGSLNISDCNNSGTSMRVALSGSTDGGRNTGITFIASSAFVQPAVSEGVYVSSTIDKNILVALIQGNSTDPYFDTPEEIQKVVVYYTHADGRQFQYAIFEGDPLTGQFLWGSGAQDGVWNKSKIVVYDWNNAKVTLNNISLESLVHASGSMNLNT